MRRGLPPPVPLTAGHLHASNAHRGPVPQGLVDCTLPRPALLLLGALATVIPSASRAQGGWSNVRLNQDATSQMQNEEQIATDPHAPNRMVAVWEDWRLGYPRVAWAWSPVAGAAWVEGGLLDEPDYPRQGEPGLSVDDQGNFYLTVPDHALGAGA